MKDSTRNARRSGWISLTGVLVLIAVFWSLYAISHRPKKPRTTVELADELGTFELPGSTQPEGTISPLQGDPAQHVVAHYRSLSDCQTLASFYKREFQRHGFQPPQSLDPDPKPESESMSFYGHDTWGHYSCKPSPRGSYYLLSLRPQPRAD